METPENSWHWRVTAAGLVEPMDQGEAMGEEMATIMNWTSDSAHDDGPQLRAPPSSPLTMMVDAQACWKADEEEKRSEEEVYEEIEGGKEEDETLSRQYCILRTLLEMVSDRGYAVRTVVPMDQFANRPRYLRALLNSSTFCHAREGKRARVVWPLDQDKPLQSHADAEQIAKQFYLDDTDLPDAVLCCTLVTKEMPSQQFMKCLERMLQRPIDHWLEQELVVNTVHRHHRPTIVPCLDTWNVHLKFGPNKNAMPTIRAKSKLGRYYNLEVDAVVRCTYEGANGKPSSTYSILK